MEREISVILVNYNGKAYNDRCIESIFRSTLIHRLRIVIVDNHSSDDSLQMLKNRWGNNENVHIIEMNQNYGFSKANNVGIKWSLQQGVKYILLLNNDTEIESNTIEKMLCCQKKNGSIVVPKILYADKPDTIWCAGGSFSPIIKKSKHRGIGEVDRGQFEEDISCTFANGCCMLLTDDIVYKAGLLDERFFLYYEDTEYSLRALERKINIWYCGKAIVYHKVNGATKGNENPANAYYITRNWLLCNRMHMKYGFIVFAIYFILNRMAWGVIWFLRGKMDMVKAMIAGIKDYHVGKTGKRIV